MSGVEVVCFDGDATLWDFDASMRAGLTDALVRLRRWRPDVGPATVDDLIADRDEVAAGMPGASVASIRRAATVAYPDVLPALRQLRERYQLALLSNGNTHPRYAGLEDYFGVLLYADDCGMRKPDERIFVELARRCGRDASQLAMVGDSLDHDVVAAGNAGWVSIWLNRDGAACPPDVHPDGIVVSLSELGAALATDRTTDPG